MREEGVSASGKEYERKTIAVDRQSVTSGGSRIRLEKIYSQRGTPRERRPELDKRGGVGFRNHLGAGDSKGTPVPDGQAESMGAPRG